MQEEIQADLDVIQEQLEVRMVDSNQKMANIQGIRENVLQIGIIIGEYIK